MRGPFLAGFVATFFPCFTGISPTVYSFFHFESTFSGYRLYGHMFGFLRNAPSTPFFLKCCSSLDYFWWAGTPPNCPGTNFCLPSSRLVISYLWFFYSPNFFMFFVSCFFAVLLTGAPPPPTSPRSVFFGEAWFTARFISYTDAPWYFWSVITLLHPPLPCGSRHFFLEDYCPFITRSRRLHDRVAWFHLSRYRVGRSFW